MKIFKFALFKKEQSNELYESDNGFRNTEDKIEKYSFYSLLALVFLLPIFVIPSSIFSLQFGKVILISILGILSFTLWIIHRLKVGSVEVPKNLLFYSIGAILVLGLISSILSGAFVESFLGVGPETSTLFFFLSLFILLLTSFNAFKDTNRVGSLYFGAFLSLSLVLIYQILRMFLGADFLDFGIFASTTSSLLGRWIDLSIIFGLSAFTTSLYLESNHSRINRLAKLALYLFAVLSLFVVFVVNSLLTWIVIATFSLFAFVYLLFFGGNSNYSSESMGGSQGRRFSGLLIALFVIAIIGILTRSQVGDFAINRFGISNIEARPSVVSTLNVARGVLENNPGFGAGFNRFNIAWGEHKPLGVNNTIFWNTNFNYGIGTIPTFLVTGGILGFVSWALFLFLFFVLGAKALFAKVENQSLRFALLSSFLGSLYLWVFLITTVTGSVVLATTFILTGAFLALSKKVGLMNTSSISFYENSKTGFIMVFVMVLLVVLNITLVYAVSGRYLSSVYASKSIVSTNEGNIEEALSNANRAVSLANTDNNYRLLSQIYVLRLNQVVNDQNQAGTEEGIALFQNVLGQSIAAATRATELDEKDYRNWLVLGSIYEAIVPLNIQGAYENAVNTYKRALEINSTNPIADLSLARLEVLNGDNNTARENITNALQKKNNYTEAIFLLSQIEINEGNINEATEAVRAASIINPNDPVVFFQLGFLEFSQSNFEGAIQSLERAVRLNPPYSNAKYFLGLSYYNTDRVEEAIGQFEDIETLNPENQEVKTILENMRDDRPPLEGLGQDLNPETREDLPVDDDQ